MAANILLDDKEVEQHFKYLQKKYPDIKFRILKIENPELNFTFSFRSSYVGATLIESNSYLGVSYKKIVQKTYDEVDTITIYLIVDEQEFSMSTIRAANLIDKYGI